MTAQLRREAEIGGYEAAAEARDAITATYDAIARLIGGRSDEVALFDNATHAWNAAFYSVALRPGDQILTGRAEYGSNVLAYWQAASRTGAEVAVVPNDEHGQLDVAALATMASDRTRLIGVSHVPTSGGLVQPAEDIGRIARACGAMFLLDATQSAGQFPVNVDAIGCDLLTGTGRKFLRGPRGTGFLWVRTAALDRLDPFIAEIGSATWDGHRSFTWAGGARRFATWEHSYVNVLGLGAAVRQALDLGLDATGQRAVALGARLRDQLGELPGVTTHDLGQTRCAIVTAKIDGLPAEQAARQLGRAGVNVPPPSLRTIRSTPKTGTSTRASGSPRTTTPRLSRSGARLTVAVGRRGVRSAGRCDAGRWRGRPGVRTSGQAVHLVHVPAGYAQRGVVPADGFLVRPFEQAIHFPSGCGRARSAARRYWGWRGANLAGHWPGLGRP
jgi:selenocysteine lyase/cysteine desulfurase